MMQAFPRVSRLSLYATSLDFLQAFQTALQTHPKIKELLLASEWTSWHESFVDLQDTSVQPGLVFRTIFSHMMPFRECKPIEATKITVNDLWLRYADRFLMKAVVFKALEYLKVITCVAPEGLKGLLFELDNAHRLPECKAFSHFGSSLRKLFIQVYNSQGALLKYKSEKIEQICTKHTSLRQLSVAFPQMRLSKPQPLSTWETCVISHSTDQPKPETAVNLPRGQSPRSESVDICENQLQRVAQNIFNPNDAYAKTQGWGLGHRSLLAIIAFGGDGETPYEQSEKADQVMLGQIFFARGTIIDALGRAKMIAVNTLLQDLQYIEPESDIIPP